MSGKAARQIPYKRMHAPPKLIGAIEVYYMLFALYILGYAVLQYTVARSDRNDTFDINNSTLIYLFTYSVFTFFLILKAAVTYSVYEYYVALFILFEKLVVITITVFKKHALNYTIQLGIMITICILNYIEFVYLIFNLFVRRQEINLYLFKLSGADPSVNSK